MVKKFFLCFILLVFLFSFDLVAQSRNVSSELLPGLEAYAREDWSSAIVFFRKGLSERKYKGDVASDALYWLILSEMSACDYQTALEDCNYYLSEYKNSFRVADVEYQCGRALYLLKMYDESIKQLYNFIKLYPENDKVPSALFWIAESLYEYKNYERATLFYNMILNDYPSSAKCEGAIYRLKLINQSLREEELLQLLKVTHEESLRAAEEYEKKCKTYEQAILAYQKRIAELEFQLGK